MSIFHLILNVLFLITLVLLESCGKAHTPGAGNSLFSSQIIVGDLDWQEITDLPVSNGIRVNGKAVATLQLPVLDSRCTGFMISDDVLMTNQHCIPSSGYARGVTATFGHVKGASSETKKSFECDEFVGNDEVLDFALLKCKGSPGRVYGKVTLEERQADIGREIYIVQQNCDYYSDGQCDPAQKFSEGKLLALKDEHEFTHDADTLGGSSGSPVFDRSTGKVVALHHAGYGNNGMGRGVENYAVRMSQVVAKLKTKFPSVLASRPSTGDTTSASNTSATKALAVTLPYEKTGELPANIRGHYFKFFVSSKTSVSVVLELEHSKGDLDLYLYDASFKAVAKSNGTSNQERFEKSLYPGTYYLKVTGYKGAAGAYQLSLE